MHFVPLFPAPWQLHRASSESADAAGRNFTHFHLAHLTGNSDLDFFAPASSASAAIMDQITQFVEPMKQFSKDSIRLVKRCTKPDRKGEELRDGAKCQSKAENSENCQVPCQAQLLLRLYRPELLNPKPVAAFIMAAFSRQDFPKRKEFCSPFRRKAASEPPTTSRLTLHFFTPQAENFQRMFAFSPPQSSRRSPSRRPSGSPSWASSASSSSSSTSPSTTSSSGPRRGTPPAPPLSCFCKHYAQMLKIPFLLR